MFSLVYHAFLVAGYALAIYWRFFEVETLRLLIGAALLRLFWLSVTYQFSVRTPKKKAGQGGMFCDVNNRMLQGGMFCDVNNRVLQGDTYRDVNNRMLQG